MTNQIIPSPLDEEKAKISAPSFMDLYQSILSISMVFIGLSLFYRILFYRIFVLPILLLASAFLFLGCYRVFFLVKYLINKGPR